MLIRFPGPRNCRGRDVQGCQDWQEDCKERMEANDHKANSKMTVYLPNQRYSRIENS